MPFTTLLVATTAEGVRTITLNRPERLNAANPALADELPAAVDEAAADDSVRAVVLTGAGRGFCAGLDLGEPAGASLLTGGGTRAERLDPYAWVGRWVQAVVGCEKPVIAAVNGPAAGAGFGLALACDVRLVAADATMTAGYVRRGLSPDAGVTYFLPRLVGLSRAMDIALSGRDVDAGEAERIGLASAALPREGFADTVAAYAARLAAGPPVALALTKRLLAASYDRTLDAQLRDELAHIKTAFATADVREALTAFKEKRAPTFRGA
ncbi:enoyl-CoA hydratase [Gemmatimonadetes bacterium T265]|nr:enoyl-CoA hydratase [Gemmatimonadetes bacterium T265]